MSRPEQFNPLQSGPPKELPEDKETGYEPANEILSGIPSELETVEKDGLDRSQQKIEGRLKGALWSYESGDPVDAVMKLPGLIIRGQRHEMRDPLVKHLADNAGEELLNKLKEIYGDAPNVTDNLEDPDWNEQSNRNFLYWCENVVPILIEILKKSEMF
jgi:hypothetical protein